MSIASAKKPNALSMKKRKVYKDIINHCYQRLEDRGVLFYSVSDLLVFFTIFCIAASKHKVKVLKLVLMPDHIHHATIEYKSGELSAFCRDYASRYAMLYNTRWQLEGALFEHPFQSVPKIGAKKARTILLYLDNNPQERQLVQKAEDYQWNFLAYGNSDHPFSDKIILREASMPLRRALKTVQSQYKGGLPMNYQLLRRLFDSLPNNRERNQLTDYIVTTYSVIDHKAAIRFFGTYEEELIAAHANTGSEYDLNEVFIGRSDAVFASMRRVIRQTGRFADLHEILSLPVPEKIKLFQLLQRETSALSKQIAAFLHLPLSAAP